MEAAPTTNVVSDRLQELRALAWYLDNRSRWNIIGASTVKGRTGVVWVSVRRKGGGRPAPRSSKQRRHRSVRWRRSAVSGRRRRHGGLSIRYSSVGACPASRRGGLCLAPS